MLGLARGRDGVGRVVGAAAAGIIVAPRSGKNNILRNFVGAAHLGAAVIPAVEGVAAAVGRRGEGDGRAAGHIVCGVSSCTIVILQGKRDLLLSRSLQIGDGIAGLCGSQSIIHTGVVTVGAAIGALDFGTDRISQITGIFQISGEAAAGDAPSSTRSGIQTTGKSTACHGNRASIVAAIKVPVFNCMIRIRVKSATIDRGNMIVLNNGLCNIAERTIVNNHCSIIIILDGVDAAGERAAVNGKLRRFLIRPGDITASRILGAIVIITIGDKAGEMAARGHGNILPNRHDAVIQDVIVAVAAAIILVHALFLAASVASAI